MLNFLMNRVPTAFKPAIKELDKFSMVDGLKSSTNKQVAELAEKVSNSY